MTLNDLFANFYRPLRLRGKSPNTVRLYGCTIRSYGRFLERSPTVEDLEDLAVARFVEHRASERSPFTAEKERSQLASLARFAFERRLLETRLDCGPPTRMPERIPSCWSVAELQRLLDTAGKTPGRIGTVPAGVWWRGIILTLWQSAERVGAITALDSRDWSRPRLIVAAEHRKGGKRDRLYTLGATCCDLLDTIADANRGKKLFYWDRCRTNLWRHFGLIVERAGLPGGRKQKFHNLRRSAATFFQAGGGDSSRLLDHSSPRVTRVYIDPRYVNSGPSPFEILPQID